MTPDRHRTFLAAYPDPATLALLDGTLAGFRSRFPEIRWSPEHQLHFTLRFFGDLDDAGLEKAVHVLETVCPAIPRPSFPLNGVGAFPDWRRPRIFWIGAGAGGEELENAARRLDIAFGNSGLGRADKPFKAHLTIGRLRDGRHLDPSALEEIRRAPIATPPFPVNAVQLMLSALGREGATHTEFRTVNLKV